MNKHLHRLFHWEYWPTAMVYLPVFCRYLYDSIRFLDPFYFTAVNPGMEAGGLYGASKYKQLKQLPKTHIPASMLCSPNQAPKDIRSFLAQHQLNYPLIVKPDRAERGRGVCLCFNEVELMEAMQHQMADFLIQEYIATPFEAAVFIICIPGKKGKVASITTKQFLQVFGDGKQSLAELLKADPRAVMAGYPERLKDKKALASVPEQGEHVLIEPIGNHNRGTRFMNGMHLWNEALEKKALELSGCIQGFHYGRFDLRCTNEADFCLGEHWKILEVNGVNAEPAHIYEPGFSLLTAWRTLLEHWKIIAEIATIHKKNGHRRSKWGEQWTLYQWARQARKSCTA